jgi:ABC-type sugar transport system substrate-binding protein
MIRRTSGKADGRALRLVALAGAFALGLAGCGSSDSGSGGAAAAGPPEGGTAKGKKVALLGCTSSNPWCNGYNTTMEAELEKAGVEVSTQTSNFDATVQAQQMSQAIARKPDLILIFPADAKAVVPSLRKAQLADIPVIVFDSPLHEEDRKYVAAELVPDHPKLGRFAAINIQEGLKKAGVEAGNVIAITGTAAEVIPQLRMDAFKAQLAKTPEYKLVEVQDGNWDPVKSGQIAQQLFAKYRGRGGVVAAYGMADYMAAAISRAAQQAGIPLFPKSDGGVVVTGSNCAGVGVKAIRAGLMYGGATQSPMLEAADHAPFVVQFLEGKQIESVVTTPVDRVTRENVDEYAKDCSF